MVEMKISVISGLYNCEKHLKKCLDSLLCQTYDNFEIILVNNASKDRTLQIAKGYQAKYPEKIYLYHTDEKLGAGGSRAKGMELAKGDYFCFVDCDDFVSCDYLELMYQCARKNQAPDIVLTFFQKVDLGGKRKYTRFYKNEKKALVQSIAPWAKMYKKEYLHNNQLLFRNMAFGEDVLFSAEVYLTHPTVALEKSVGYFWLDNLLSASHVELRHFPAGVMKTSVSFFDEMKSKYPSQNKVLCYFAVKYYLWYLLQSGRSVPTRLMKRECKKVLNALDHLFPGWDREKFLLHEDRGMIKVAVYWGRILNRYRLLTGLLMIYTKLPMEKLWPSL